MPAEKDILRIAASLQTLIRSLAIVDEVAATRLDREFSKKLVIAIRGLYADLATSAAKEFAKPRKYPRLQDDATDTTPYQPEIKIVSSNPSNPGPTNPTPQPVGVEELPPIRTLPISAVVGDVTPELGGTGITNRSAFRNQERANPYIKRLGEDEIDEAAIREAKRRREGQRE